MTYYPQVPSYRGGVSTESYKLQIYELLDDQPPRWTYDTGMGLQSEPAEGDKRADWDYEWTFKPVAWDIDGDGRAEIVTLARNDDTDGVYKYVALKDVGDRCQVIGALNSPVPVAPCPMTTTPGIFRSLPIWAASMTRSCSKAALIAIGRCGPMTSTAAVSTCVGTSNPPSRVLRVIGPVRIRCWSRTSTAINWTKSTTAARCWTMMATSCGRPMNASAAICMSTVR